MRASRPPSINRGSKRRIKRLSMRSDWTLAMSILVAAVTAMVCGAIYVLLRFK